MVVEVPPVVKDDLCVPDGEEDLPIQAFHSQPRVEAFRESVLPGFTRFDVPGLDVLAGQPQGQVMGDKFRSVVAPYKRWWAVQGHEFLQSLPYLLSCEAVVCTQSQTATSELVFDGQDADGRAILQALMDEIVGPNLVWASGCLWNLLSRTDFLGYFAFLSQVFLLPDAVHTFAAYLPPFTAEQFVNKAVTTGWMFQGQITDTGRELSDVRRPWLVVEAGRRQTRQFAGPFLGQSLTVKLLGSFTLLTRGYRFFARTSFMASSSNCCWPTSRKRRSFSRWRRRRSLAWSLDVSPNFFFQL